MINHNLADLLDSFRSFSAKRSLVLIRDHSSGDPNWAYWVPPCFNAALDIRMTPRMIEGRQVQVWTQGGLLSFAVGDSLHSLSNGAYTQSLQCVQVVTSSADFYSDDSGFVSGRVEFDIYARPDVQSAYQKVRRETLTQLDFLKMLIWGENPENK